MPPAAGPITSGRQQGPCEPASLGFRGFTLGITDGLGHRSASCLAFLARLNTLFHLRVIVSGTDGGAGLARVGASQASDRDQRALARHELRREAAEFLAVDRDDSDLVVVGVTILDLLEAVMKRLVADRGACLARLEAITVQLVVVVGVLRWPGGQTRRSDRLRPPRGRPTNCDDPWFFPSG